MRRFMKGTVAMTRVKFTRISAALLSLLIIFTCLAPAGKVRAESLYVHKVVSVVYDDSGSMTGSDANWAYANYAMQTFCALLNDDDQLYITFMSDKKTYDFSARTIDPQKAVDTLSAHSDSGNTPFEAVENAFAKLRSVTDYDKNTQFWLVIFTDGEFTDSLIDNNSDALTSMIKSRYMATPMPNGSSLKVSYFGIGDSAIIPRGDPSEGAYISVSSGSRQIFEELSRISDKISGRYRVEQRDIRPIDSRTVELRSDIALLNIVTLVQNSGARIDRVECTEGDLAVRRETRLKTPVGNGEWTTDPALNGVASLISSVGGQKIPRGTYRITFTEDIDPSLLTVMFEPAIYLKAQVLKDGMEVTDYTQLYADDTIDVIFTLCEQGTDEPIDDKLLPGGVSYNLTVTEDGNISSSVPSSSIEGITLSELPTAISSTAEIAGIAPINSTVYFSPTRLPVTGLEATPETGFTVDIGDLKKNEDGITFYMLIDGQHATPVQAAGRELDVDCRLKVDVKQQSDGSWLVVPKATWPLMFVRKGEATVTGTVNGVSATATINITNKKWWIPILDLLWPLLVLLLLLWRLLRKRFHTDRIECITYEIRNTGDVVQQNSPGGTKVNPLTDPVSPFAARVKKGGVTFVADSTIFSSPSVKVSIKSLQGKQFSTAPVKPKASNIKNLTRRLKTMTPDKCMGGYTDDIALTGSSIIVLSGSIISLYRMKSDAK